MYILICDDDSKYIEKCKLQLESLAKKHNVDIKIDTVISGKQLLFDIENKYSKVDLIYLDQNMPDLNGIDTAKQLRKQDIQADIVFYTVDENHIIDGYDVEAMHYIVKGKTTDDKFEEIFLKAVKRAKKRHTDILSLSCAGQQRNVLIDDILYFEVQHRIVTIHYYKENKEETFEFYSSLSKIEEALYNQGFLRIHSSYIVSEKFVTKKTTKQVTLLNQEIIPVGKSYRNVIKNKHN